MRRETSRDAYYSLTDLGKRQEEVLQALKKLGEATNLEVATYLGRPINTVTPRTFELRKTGAVIEGGKRKCRVSGRTAISWRAVSYQCSLGLTR